MAMTRKRRRIILIGIGAGFVLAASLLVGVGMRDSIVFFFSPSVSFPSFFSCSLPFFLF